MPNRLVHLWRGTVAASPVRRLLLALGVVLFLVWGFAALAGEVAEGETRAADEWALRALRTSDLADPIGPPWLEDMARDVTALGGNFVITFLILTVTSSLVLHRRYREAVFVVVSIGVGFGLLFALKFGFERPRPALVPHLQHVSTSSFPSGHSMGAVLTYLTLAALIARMERRPLDQAFPIVVALTLSLLVGVSRVYLGVHYPTDVLGGWAIGMAWAVGCWAAGDWMERRTRSA